MNPWLIASMVLAAIGLLSMADDKKPATPSGKKQKSKKIPASVPLVSSVVESPSEQPPKSAVPKVVAKVPTDTPTTE